MIQSSTVYQLKASLAGSDPLIWRRIVVPSSLTLARLHHVLQIVVGWQDCHLHSFEIGGRTYGDNVGSDWGVKVHSERKARLAELVSPGETFVYVYDFGDNWEHDIELETVAVAEPDGLYPICVDGAGAGPPEDCGGLWGYHDLVEALADPNHEEHESMTEWVGGSFDSNHFDIKSVNTALSPRPAPRQRRKKVSAR